jgi:hypothetical protein
MTGSGAFIIHLALEFLISECSAKEIAKRAASQALGPRPHSRKPMLTTDWTRRLSPFHNRVCGPTLIPS